MSTTPSLSLAPVISFNSSAARCRPVSASSGSTPRSKRNEASVCRPCRLAVRRMDTASKHALSRNTAVVASVTPLPCPPNTPAMHSPPLTSAIIRSSALSFRSTPSRVVNAVPSGRCFTSTWSSAIRSASKAWSGCPSSCCTKLVTSTTLLIGFKPMASRRSCSQAGEGPTITPVSVRPV